MDTLFYLKVIQVLRATYRCLNKMHVNAAPVGLHASRLRIILSHEPHLNVNKCMCVENIMPADRLRKSVVARGYGCECARAVG